MNLPPPLRAVLSLMIFSAGVLCAPKDASAQFGIPTVLLAGKTVGDLLDQFEGVANRLLQNATQSGNTLGTKFGNEVGVATRNMELALDNQRNRLFEDLNPTQQQLFIELNGMIEAANRSVDRAATMTEIANLNLIEFTNRLPLTDRVHFYVSSIRGLTQYENQGGYKLFVRGLGFGLPPGNREYAVSARLGTTEIPATSLRPVSATDLEIDIPANLIASHFRETTIANVPFRLRTRITTREGILRRRRERTYEMPVTLILLPKSAGTLMGAQPIAGDSLSRTVDRKSVVQHLNDCTSRRPCDFSHDIRLANDEELVGVDYGCAGNCGWSYNLRSGGYPIDYDVVDGGKRVVFYRHVDAGGVTVTHYALVRRRLSFTRQSSIAPIRVQYGREAQFDTDPRNRACEFELRGQLATGQSPYIDSGMERSLDGTVSKVAVTKLGDRCRVTLRLNLP